MKKILLAAVMCSAISASYSQTFYIQGSLGYALPVGGQQIVNQTANNGPFGVSSYEIHRGSYSAGVQANIGGGYLFNKNFGVEIDINTVFAPTGVKDHDVIATGYGVGSVSDYKTTKKTKFPIYAVPSMVFQTSGDKWRLYSRVGVCLALRSKIFGTYSLTENGYLKTDEQWEIKNNFSLGFSSAVGMQCRIDKNTCINAEITMLSMSLFEKEATRIDHLSNGHPMSGYNGTISYSTNGSGNNTQPASLNSFNNLGFNIGVRREFGGNGRKQTAVSP